MKRFFFDLSDGGWEPDETGTELQDDASAQRQAIRFAGEILTHEPHRLQRGEMRVNVHDLERAVLFSIVVRLETGSAEHGAGL